MDFSVIYSIPGFAVINKPFNVAMDGEINENSTTVQHWAESNPEAQKMLRIAKNQFQKEEQQQQKNDKNDDDDDADDQQSQRRNTKDVIDGKVRFVHQLDFSTSGLLCLAFSKRQAAKVTYCFETRSSRKEYLAVLDGWVAVSEEENSISSDVVMIPLDEIVFNLQNPPSNSLNPDLMKRILAQNKTNQFDRILVSHPIGQDSSDPKKFRMKSVEPNKKSTTGIRQRQEGSDEKEDEINSVSNPKPASSIFTVLARGFLKEKTKEEDEEDESRKAPKRKVTLVHLQLLTGRRHQLRVHSLAIGHPIVGDNVYSGLPKEQQDCERMLLHAWRLGLPKSQISLALTGEEENELFKKRRKEIKQVRKHQQQQQKSEHKGNDGNEDDEDEEEEKIFFVSPEPLTEYFALE
jgi:23S rRNA-/tRNA-specific pseudouridylate synthase